MEFSKNGVVLLKELEGCKEYLYYDSGGLATIGIGHLLTYEELSTGIIKINVHFINHDLHGLTKEQCEELLVQDLRKFIEAVDSYVKVPLSQNQFDALVCFVYNIGVGAFINSTLLRKLNRKLYIEVPTELKRWNKAKGKPVQGLTNRRNKEISLWKKEE
jgi:lysozyme